MKYMTNKMLQRFMSHMAANLRNIQAYRKETEEQIIWEKRFECGTGNYVLLV